MAAERAPGPRGARRRQILEVAAARFRSHGYGAASMRDIAGQVGILAGSLYHHFPSKDDLFTAVYEEGVRRITAAVTGAVAGIGDPWARLEAAMVAHLNYLLEGGDFAVVVLRALPADLRGHRRLVALRDGYEDLFRALIDDLPLPPRLAGAEGRDSLRLMLLGALNWTQTWYRPDGAATPARIARDFLALLRGAL
ncbi:MAG: TetR/AcrR family transcriptional regulator [Hyphomicrobiales bacterium]|nr:TetR/AcrR family transcriptional regulator [Hyphomicrobiales bacterium]